MTGHPYRDQPQVDPLITESIRLGREAGTKTRDEIRTWIGHVIEKATKEGKTTWRLSVTSWAPLMDEVLSGIAGLRYKKRRWSKDYDIWWDA